MRSVKMILRAIRKKSNMLVCALVMMLVLSGCGEEMIPLSDGEEEKVVSYAAHVVGKYNGKQREGLVYISEPKKEETTGEEDKTEEKTEETEESQEEVSQQDEKSEDSSDDVQQHEAEEPQEETRTDTVSWSEALGLGDVAAQYTGFDLTSSYIEGDYYALNAEPGKTFLVMHVDMTNNAAEAMNCNLLSAGPVFTLTVNDMNRVEAETTILLNDLSTYVGNLEVGQTVSTVLLFQVDEAVASDVQKLSLKVFINGGQVGIQL